MLRSAIVFTLLLPTLAFAQVDQVQKETAPTKERVSRVDFGEEDSVYGETEGPGLELVTTDSRVAHDSLIRVRESFRKEALASVTQL